MSGFRATERPEGIWEFRFRDFKRDTIDEWVQTSLEQIQLYHARNQHLRQIYYFENRALPTPYGTSQTLMLAQSLPNDMMASVAALTSNNAIVSLIRVTVKRIPGTDYLRIFQYEAEADAWMNQRDHEFISQR